VSWRYRISARFPTLVIARRNVSRAKVRSALAAASILIGVVAIGTIGAGGAAFKQSQLQTIKDQGATNVFVSPGFDKETSAFDREDLKAIDETVGPAGVVATKQTTRRLVTRGDDPTTVSVTYTEDPRALYDVQAGAVPADWRRSAVVSNEFASEHGLAPGDRVTLAPDAEQSGSGSVTEQTYRVVAVLASTQSFGVSDVYLPIEQAANRQYSQVRVTTSSVDRAEAAAAALRQRFNDRKDRLLVFELTSLVRLFKSVVNGINVFLAALGAISLLVAGVSIANTMLMAVIKRREEIGVRRAVGYAKTDVVRILLVEAALLGLAGSVAGIAVALVATMVANLVFLGDPTAFSATAVGYLVGAVAFGVLTSLIAGVYPAWRAANDRPVDALRG
jgi:putative ABC transport system permease protein